jgi:hypothetical protein
MQGWLSSCWNWKIESKNWKKKMKLSAMNAKIEARYAQVLIPASGYRVGWEAAIVAMKEMLRYKLLG